MAENYTPVALSKIRPNQELPVDVFVKVNEKHIKYKHAGDSISAEKYDLFLSMNQENIHIDQNDEPKFNSWMKTVKEKEMQEILSRVGEENKDMAENAVAIKEKLYTSFSSPELKETAVKGMLADTQKLVSNLKAQKKNVQALAFLTTYNQNLAEHSTNVGSLSIFLAMNLGQTHNLVLENVYMGGLYHDYGKVKIPAKILENNKSPAYANAMKVHAKMGRDALIKMSFLSKQILTIVLEHHEQFNGHGTPDGKQGEEIYNLSKIVSIANTFDNIVSEDKAKGVKNIFHRAFKILEMDNGRLFDPAVLRPSLNSLREAYKNGEVKF